jgi:hypothetical protein
LRAILDLKVDSLGEAVGESDALRNTFAKLQAKITSVAELKQCLEGEDTRWVSVEIGDEMKKRILIEMLTK